LVEASDLQVGWGKIKKVTDNPNWNEKSPLIECYATACPMIFAGVPLGGSVK